MEFARGVMVGLAFSLPFWVGLAALIYFFV